MEVRDIKTPLLEKTCKEFGVKELYAFGSVVSGSFSEKRDLDFLVEFHRNGYKGAFDQFIDFKQRLEQIYERPVDLITNKKFRNPVFQEEIDKSKTLIYAS